MDWNDEDIGYKVANRVWGCGFSIIIVIIICLACSVCCSCSSSKEVVTEYVHDTITVNKTDTVVDVKVREVRDTTKQIETHTYTINNAGDTVKEIHHYHDVLRTVVVDSTQRYQSKIDSLQAIINKSKEKQEVKVVRKPNWWGYAFVAGLAFVLSVWFLSHRKK